MKRCTTLLEQQQGKIQQQKRRIKEAEVDKYRRGTIIYTTGEVFKGKVHNCDIVENKNMWDFLTCDSYLRARQLHCSIGKDIKHSREKPKVDGVPYDAMQTRLELESNHGSLSLPFFDKAIVQDYMEHACRKAVDNGVDYDTTKSRLELDTKYNSMFRAVFDNTHDCIFEEWRYREILTNFVKHAYRKALDKGVKYDAIKTHLQLENKYGSAFLPVFDKRHDHFLDK